MSEEIRFDGSSEDCSVVNGIEHHAVWIPISSEEKKALLGKAASLSIDIPGLAVAVLRGRLSEPALTEDELDRVVGGQGGTVPAGAIYLYSAGGCSYSSVFDARYGRYFTKKTC